MPKHISRIAKIAIAFWQYQRLERICKELNDRYMNTLIDADFSREKVDKARDKHDRARAICESAKWDYEYVSRHFFGPIAESLHPEVKQTNK